MKTLKKASLALSIQAALLTSFAASAQQADANAEQEKPALEVIQVTAQKRTQTLKEVPISIATLHGEKFENMFSAGDDILTLATRVPGLYAESSNGRVAPRFYIRGLGNTDFDLAASQPVSIIMDEVVMENVVLKSFPLFDIQRVEVIRGPQGTLFGRNTTAGMVKFDTVKPSEYFEGYAKLGLASFGTTNFEGAVGGGLAEGLSGRISVLSQERDDWIDNGYTGEKDAMGGYDEKAWRAQLLYEQDDFNALLNVHGRSLDGTSSIFRANIFSAGSNDLNGNYDRDTVYYDEGEDNGDNNPQNYDGFGASLKLEMNLGDMTLTSITAKETADGRSFGDIDGGYGAVYLPEMGPGFIPFNSQTQDAIDDLNQFTQEIRLASDLSGDLNWQVGYFYFDADLQITTNPFFAPETTILHENSTWAVFGQTTYKASEKLSITGGIRYTDDEKSLSGISTPLAPFEDINEDDGQVSWELSANYALDNDTSLFARAGYGFRAQSIQGRDVAFGTVPSVADSETIMSYEAGYKADLLDRTLRLNAALFYYEIDDMQFTAIGGGGNFTSLINADGGTGYGFEVDMEWRPLDELLVTAGYSYNKTEIEDSNLYATPCGSGMCTPTDPMRADGAVLIDGNPFPQAPKTIFNFTARYSVPVGENGEFFAYTDWAFQGETNLFLYEAVEFKTDDNFEGGFRIGYENFDSQYQIALFGRNITDEHNVKGGIDFNNLTGIVNEPRVWGVEFKKRFE